jgi:cytochrome c biogenesis protein CcdA
MMTLMALMTLWILAYVGGALTILSPCILPVLPFVFARAEQPFINSTLPMLAGMAATFEIEFLDPGVKAFAFTFG